MRARSASEVSNRDDAGWGRFFPTEVRSERRGAGEGWEASALHRSSTELSTAEVIRSLTRVNKLPVGMPWLSLRAPCLGARSTNFGKSKKRRNVSQEG